MIAARGYVCRPRGVLRAAAALRHRPSGYSLSVQTVTVDAAEFEQLLGAARAAAAAASPRAPTHP